ncbi:MAG TPA: avidin/streptavidin family protein [Mucilaginibacter sp.]|nr:avidin/streptavidin family protein [Mucilaginibacter sp.]
MFVATAYGQNSNDLIGIWHNELQETLTITAISSTGQLTGTYRYRPETDDSSFQLNGWAGPDTAAPKKGAVVPVIFMAWMAPYGSVKVWSGYLTKADDGRTSIFTIWNVIRALADPDPPLDQSAINKATFKPGAAQ